MRVYIEPYFEYAGIGERIIDCRAVCSEHLNAGIVCYAPFIALDK